MSEATLYLRIGQLVILKCGLNFLESPFPIFERANGITPNSFFCMEKDE